MWDKNGTITVVVTRIEVVFTGVLSQRVRPILAKDPAR